MTIAATSLEAPGTRIRQQRGNVQRLARAAKHRLIAFVALLLTLAASFVFSGLFIFRRYVPWGRRTRSQDWNSAGRWRDDDQHYVHGH